MIFAEVNFALIIGAAIVRCIIGMGWYTFSFGKVWMEEMVKSRKNRSLYKPQTGLLVSFLVSCLMAFMMYIFAEAAHTMNFQQGVFLGLFTWLGFSFPVTISSVFYEGDSFTLFAIHAGYNVFSMMVMGGMIAQWGGF